MPKGQRKYSQEFKEQAISLVTERGYTHTEAGKGHRRIAAYLKILAQSSQKKRGWTNHSRRRGNPQAQGRKQTAAPGE